jgi:hypothetical protein
MQDVTFIQRVDTAGLPVTRRTSSALIVRKGIPRRSMTS